MQSLLISWVNVLRKLIDDVPNSFEVKILCHPSESEPDSPGSRFVNIAVFKIRDSSISS